MQNYYNLIYREEGRHPYPEASSGR
jgi:hypothetical protein